MHVYTTGAPSYSAPSSPTCCCPSQLRRDSDRPIRPIQANGGSVLIPDLVGVDEWASDQTASDRSAAMVVHGRKPIYPIHDRSSNSNDFTIGTRRLPFRPPPLAHPASIGCLITIIGQKTHESTMIDRFPPDLQQINEQILVRQRESIKLKPQPSSTSSLDPVASSIEQSKAVQRQD
ncbi:hypothetical protein ACLOJK_014752 [Asimina triloba]